MNKAYPDKEYRDKVFKIWQEDIFHVLKTDNSHSSKRLYTITAKSGVLVDAELSFTIIDDEIYVIFDDVSQKIKAEKDLKTSEQKFENIFNMSPDMVGITLQANGRIVAGNPQFTTLTGYTYNEFIGATTIELGLWADPEDRNRMMKMLLRDGKVDNQVFGMRIKDGSVLTCLFSAQAIQFDGEPCLIFVVHDITERIKNEEKIKINEARLIRAQAVGHIGYSEQIIGDDMVWASAEAKSIYGLDPVDGFVKIDQIKQATIDLDYFIKSVANWCKKGVKWIFNMPSNHLTKTKLNTYMLFQNLNTMHQVNLIKY
jgi:PAS domain S-box-containing protein